jgi:hypothetical protein
MVWRIVCFRQLDFGTEYYRYAQSLRAINQNDKANEVMELFSQKSANDGRALNKIPLSTSH